MNTKPSSKPIGRKALREALETVPTESLFSPAVSRELTGKQKKFAREVAMGATKADAYRKAYNPKSKWTMQTQPYQLSRDERVANEIEAIKRAIAAQEYQNPAALRALVIQSLVGVITNPDANPGQITAAAKVLGTVTEISAFTERREVRTITSSEDARAKIMAELKTLANAEAVDVTAIDSDADSLLAELAIAPESETHPPPDAHFDEQESRGTLHTIPHEQLPSYTNWDDDTPTPSTQEDPPSSFEK
jgi:hypothetical protein